VIANAPKPTETVDLAIVTVTTQATSAAQQATTTIPIVIIQVSDPLGSGFVASLAHPGGNITGITDFGIDLAAKYVELAHAIAPKATRIGVLMSDHPLHPVQLKLTRDAATSIGSRGCRRWTDPKRNWSSDSRR
jgi:putative ABC transport system substrate-binding protein